MIDIFGETADPRERTMAFYVKADQDKFNAILAEMKTKKPKEIENFVYKQDDKKNTLFVLRVKHIAKAPERAKVGSVKRSWPDEPDLKMVNSMQDAKAAEAALKKYQFDVESPGKKGKVHESSIHPELLQKVLEKAGYTIVTERSTGTNDKHIWTLQDKSDI